MADFNATAAGRPHPGSSDDMGPLSLYVSSVSGSDSAGCGHNSSTPCRSISHALKARPREIWLFPGTYNASEVSVQSQAVDLGSVSSVASLNYVAINGIRQGNDKVFMACAPNVDAPVPGDSDSYTSGNFMYVDDSSEVFLANLTLQNCIDSRGDLKFANEGLIEMNHIFVDVAVLNATASTIEHTFVVTNGEFVVILATVLALITLAVFLGVHIGRRAAQSQQEAQKKLLRRHEQSFMNNLLDGSPFTPLVMGPGVRHRRSTGSSSSGYDARAMTPGSMPDSAYTSAHVTPAKSRTPSTSLHSMSDVRQMQDLAQLPSTDRASSSQGKVYHPPQMKPVPTPSTTAGTTNGGAPGVIDRSVDPLGEPGGGALDRGDKFGGGDVVRTPPPRNRKERRQTDDHNVQPRSLPVAKTSKAIPKARDEKVKATEHESAPQHVPKPNKTGSRKHMNRDHSKSYMERILHIKQELLLKSAYIDMSEVQLHDQLGHGAFGVVYRGTWRQSQCAVKMIQRNPFIQLLDEDIRVNRREAILMCSLKHPNILLTLGIGFQSLDSSTRMPTTIAGKYRSPNLAQKKSSDNQKLLCIVTELLERGSLFDVLSEQRDKFLPELRSPESGKKSVSKTHSEGEDRDARPTTLDRLTFLQILHFALDAARGMLFLHQNSPPIVHRDLKSSNLLVDQNWVVKVCDFGNSRLAVRTKVVADDAKAASATPGSTFSPHRAHLTPNPNGGLKSPGFHVGSPGEKSRRGFFSPKSPQRTPGANSPAGNVETHREIVMTNTIGTAAWTAPELFTMKGQARFKSVDRALAIDVYSFGIVLWEMITFRIPFNEETKRSRFAVSDAVAKGLRPPLPSKYQRRSAAEQQQTIPNFPVEGVPSEYVRLVTDCWHQHPRRRPSFAKIFARLEAMREKCELECKRLAERRRKEEEIEKAALSRQSSGRPGLIRNTSAPSLSNASRGSLNGLRHEVAPARLSTMVSSSTEDVSDSSVSPSATSASIPIGGLNHPRRMPTIEAVAESLDDSYLGSFGDGTPPTSNSVSHDSVDLGEGVEVSLQHDLSGDYHDRRTGKRDAGVRPLTEPGEAEELRRPSGPLPPVPDRNHAWQRS